MSLDELFEQLRHPNPHLRDQTMWEIADARDDNTIPRLMNILDETDVPYRRAAVKTLGAIGHDAIPAVMEGLLNSENVTVRGSCAKALAQIAANHRQQPFPEIGLNALRKAIDDDNPVVYIASVMALGETGSPAFELLAEALETTQNPAAGVAIVNALGSLKDERSAALLKKVSEDESADSYVKETATSALSRLDMIMNYKRS
jgi:bilin biosynthesis protein